VRGLFIGLVAALALVLPVAASATVQPVASRLRRGRVVQPLWSSRSSTRGRVRSACCTKADARSRTGFTEGHRQRRSGELELEGRYSHDSGRWPIVVSCGSAGTLARRSWCSRK